MPILSREELVALCNSERDRGRRIVFTNGCFDILHAGHVSYLTAAAALGDILVVGLNTDASVRRLKGPDRPIVDEESRAMVVASLRAVDHVTLFDEETPLELIAALRPDVLVKGGDYDPTAIDGPRYIVGSDIVSGGGGEVRVIDVVEGASTTNIIARIVRTHCPGQRADERPERAETK
jgi:D-beta-D-heptose 7-phosphate kinase/D-beta-D-heptose 1-phosphate adenosyltransferase